MFSKEMSERGICFANLNFHGSDHWKGVPDGVGGSLKRTGNLLVMHGHEITDAASFISSIQEQDKSVYLYEVAEIKYHQIHLSKSFKLSLEHIKCTKIRTTRNVGEVWYREVSCRCDEGEIHVGHEWNLPELLR